MKSPILMLAIGLAGGILIGRQLKHCPTLKQGASTNDVLSQLLGVGTKVWEKYA